MEQLWVLSALFTALLNANVRIFRSLTVIGGGYFCFKLCDPKFNDGHNYCQNRYDLMGCSYSEY